MRARIFEGEDPGEEVDVETYVWASEIEELEKGEWDFREFMKEKAAAWIGVEREDYVGEYPPRPVRSASSGDQKVDFGQRPMQWTRVKRVRMW